MILAGSVCKGERRAETCTMSRVHILRHAAQFTYTAGVKRSVIMLGFVVEVKCHTTIPTTHLLPRGTRQPQQPIL